MKRLVTVTLLAFMAVCCGPARYVQQDVQRDTVTTVIRDSIFFRDSIFLVKVEAEKDSVVLPDTDTSYLSTRYAESEAYVSGGRLHHSLRNRSEALIPIEVRMPVKIHFESKSSIRDRHAVEVVEVERQLTKWQKFVMALGYGLLGALVAWVAVKLAKIIR